MNRGEFIDLAGRTGFFIARHSLAVFVTVAVACVLWTMIYAGLLVWAMVADGNIGSPAVYPLGLIATLAGCTLLATVLLFPCTALAEWIAMRRGWPIPAQLPVSIGILAGICTIVVGAAALMSRQANLGEALVVLSGLFGGSLLPLGLYWWTAQSGPFAMSLFRFLKRKFPAEVSRDAQAKSQ